MIRLSSLACFLLGGFLLSAQTYEITPTAGYIRYGHAVLGSLNETEPTNTDTRLKTGAPAYGVRLTANTPGYYGFELGYLRSQPTLYTRVPQDEGDPIAAQSRITVQHYSLDFLLYMMPKGERVRPFLAVGGQAVQYSEPKIEGWTRYNSRNYGVNWGGGLKLKIVKNLLFRFDLRDYIGGKPYDLTWEDNKFSGGLWHHVEGSIGLGITF